MWSGDIGSENGGEKHEMAGSEQESLCENLSAITPQEGFSLKSRKWQEII